MSPAAFNDFAWTAENLAKVATIKARYPKPQSAVMPLLDLAQRQVGAATGTQGWLPVPVLEFIARELGMAYIRVHEVASFYTMYNLAPVGKFHVQLCGTTPCMLRGAEEVMRACNDMGMKKGQTTGDGIFTLHEVECLGACVNAPMVQINDDYYEDLDYTSTRRVLEELKAGGNPTPGPQIDRHCAAPLGGPTVLKDEVKA